MTNLEEKIKEMKKVSEPRKHKVNHSLGVYDAYKWIRKNKWLNIGQAITEHQFYTIVRNLNKLLAKDLLTGKDAHLPGMGKLELRKSLRRIDFVNGKLVTSLPIDWDRTLKFWAEHGKSDKVIRHENREVFRVIYNKSKASYNNKSFIEFSLNRTVKQLLKTRITNKQLDAFTL